MIHQDDEPDIVQADEVELLSFAAEGDEVDEEIWSRLEAVPSIQQAA